jgi:small subunit ribosomal protein S18
MGNKKQARRAPEPDPRKFRKKTSILTHEGITYVDYKDVNLLRKFMSERAKIRQRRVTGNSQKQQREIARAVRIAREMALLPFNVRQVTSKTKRRRNDEDENTLEAAERRAEKAERSARAPRAPREEKEHYESPEATPAEESIEAEAQEMIEAEAVVAGEEA